MDHFSAHILQHPGKGQFCNWRDLQTAAAGVGPRGNASAAKQPSWSVRLTICRCGSFPREKSPPVLSLHRWRPSGELRAVRFPTGTQDSEVMRAKHTLAGISILVSPHLGVYTLLFPIEPFQRSLSHLDGPSDSHLPPASPEHLQWSRPQSVISDIAGSGGGPASRFSCRTVRAIPSEPAAPLSALACRQTTLSSDHPPPRATNSSGHVSPGDRPSPLAAAASWSRTNRRSSSAAAVAASGLPPRAFSKGLALKTGWRAPSLCSPR
jgi:hypothetical protein